MPEVRGIYPITFTIVGNQPVTVKVEGFLSQVEEIAMKSKSEGFTVGATKYYPIEIEGYSIGEIQRK